MAGLPNVPFPGGPTLRTPFLIGAMSWFALRDRLGAPPTTGAMLIDLALRSGLASLTLYGFDFFASQSLSGRRTAAQVPHDFGAEAAWVGDMQRRDPRLDLVA